MSSFACCQQTELTIYTENLLVGCGWSDMASDGCAAWPWACTHTAGPQASHLAVGSEAETHGKADTQGCPPIPPPSHRKHRGVLAVYLFLLCHQGNKHLLLSFEFFFTQPFSTQQTKLRWHFHAVLRCKRFAFLSLFMSMSFPTLCDTQHKKKVVRIQTRNILHLHYKFVLTFRYYTPQPAFEM